MSNRMTRVSSFTLPSETFGWYRVVSMPPVAAPAASCSAGYACGRSAPKNSNTLLKESFTYKGYCSYHDGALFRPIETAGETLDHKSNQCLALLRGVNYERRKKQELVEAHSLMLKKYKSRLRVQRIEDAIRGFKYGMSDLQKLSNRLHQVVSEGPSSEGIELFRRVVPFSGITFSSTFDAQSDTEKSRERNVLRDGWQGHLPSYVVGLFPVNDEESIFLLGTFDGHHESVGPLMTSLEALDEEGVALLISEIVTRHIETWAVSPSFYRSNVKARLDLFNRLFMQEEPTLVPGLKPGLHLWNLDWRAN